MDKPPPLNDDERENLVAYLDGELDDDTARELEVRLSLDPRAREEAETLRRTWEMLDYLPRAEPSPSFTNRTLERLEPVRSTMLRSAGWRRGRPWLLGVGWAAAVLLAATGGFAGMTFLQHRGDSDHELVRDLRVIENKRYYDRVDDLDFLRELDHPDLFGDDHPDSGG